MRLLRILLIAALAVGAVALMPEPAVAISGNGSAENPYIIYDVDDLQAINDHIGPRYSRPWDDDFGYAGQGGSWTVFPDDGTYWDKVDEATSDVDSTFIQATTDGAYCLLSHEATPLSLPSGASGISVAIKASVRNVSSGTSYIQGMLNIDGTEYLIGTDTAISSTSYATKTWTMTEYPPRGYGGWTVDDVYALSTSGVGVKVSDATPNIRITQIWIEVTYTLAPYCELANDIDASATSGWNPTTDRGTWQTSTVYNVNDYVTYSSSYYVCKTAHTSSGSFAGANWWLFYSTIPNAYLGFLPIGDVSTRFTGSLDGKGYIITGLYINRTSDSTGLFGETKGSTLLNIKLASISITGRNSVGALVGEICGEPTPCTITNCNAAGTVNGNRFVGGLIGYSYSATITGCYSSCTVVSTDDEVGGFIGQFDGEGSGTLTNCYATGGVTGHYYVGGFIGEMLDCTISECYSTGDINATQYAGGFVGDIDGSGTISNAYSRGNVTATNVGGFVRYNDGGTIQNCYSTGLVTGSTAGGFCQDNNATITSCYWDIQASGQATSDGGTGRETIDMTSIPIYEVAAWNIAEAYIPTLWRNDGYPVLGWMFGSGYDWLIHAAPDFGEWDQVLWFQPNAIILDTTLPDRAGTENGIIAWGANPEGIDISHSLLEPEKTYRFEPVIPDTWDIINPEPAPLTGDVDLERLKKNPLYLLVQVITAAGGFTERLAWLCLAFFILVAVMIATHLLGREHLVFTSLAGLGVSVMFYVMGVWGLWVVLLLIIGLVASIVYERMPTL